MDKRDYYEVLRIGKDATERDIKKAYRKMAMEYHPDRNSGSKEAEEKFKEAAEAYEVLSDPEKRKIYNMYGHEGLSRSGFSGFSGVHDIFSHFSDLFSDFFGGEIFGFGGESRQRSRRASRGGDLLQTVRITFEEAFTGCRKPVDVEHYERCIGCNGTGAKDGTGMIKCPTCDGNGQVVHSRGMFMISTTCHRCQGRGTIIKEMCERCEGAGKEKVSKKVSVKIPAGVDTGIRMRIPGEGEGGSRGGPSGDLYIDIEVEPHEIFSRREYDIHMELPISFVQATLGEKMTVPTMNGEKEISIPAGTQPGDLIKLRDEGFPLLKGEGRGDLLIQVKVVIPKKLTKEQEAILLKYAEISGMSITPEKKSIIKKIIQNLT